MEIIFIDEEIKKFILNLHEPTKAKVLRTIDMLEKFSYKLGLPHTKKIQKNLFELRILGKNQVRLFYTFVKPNIIVLCGFRKKTQKIPADQIKKALVKLKRLDTI